MENSQPANIKTNLHIESCQRLMLVSSFRMEEGEYFQAVSVLNQALHYLNGKNFIQCSEEIGSRKKQLIIQIQLRLVKLFILLKKYKFASQYLGQILKNQRNNLRALGLEKELQEKMGRFPKPHLKEVS